MIVIVAHHYVVNSGLMPLIRESNNISFNSIFLLLFGWGGKTGINCFVLITGYFMCTSKITLKKFLKLIFWMEFYKIIFYLIFTLSGYQEFSIISMIKSVLPVTSIADGFGSAYLVFFLFIPFLNILIKGMDKKKHLMLMLLLICVYTVFAIFEIIGFTVKFNYVTWFCVIYIIGSYIRLYPEEWFSKCRLWGILSLFMIVLSWASVVAGVFVKKYFGIEMYYYFVVDSNKPLALATSICAFMYFKNLNLGYVKAINTIAASAYGVLLIHANSDAMRQWLWKDTLNNVEQFNLNTLVVHALCSVVAIYIICTLIDMIRIKFIEKPFFGFLEKHKILK